jgi:hypothetical protein
MEKLPFTGTRPADGFAAHVEMRHKDVISGDYDAETEYIFNFVDNLRNR